MVIPNDAELLLLQPQGGDDVHPDQGVGPDHVELLVGQPAGLVQDVVLDADLADVVKRAARLEHLDLFVVAAHPARDADRVVGDAGRVLLGVGVLGFDGADQGEERGDEALLQVVVEGDVLHVHGGLLGQEAEDEPVLLVEGLGPGLVPHDEQTEGLAADPERHHDQAGMVRDPVQGDPPAVGGPEVPAEEVGVEGGAPALAGDQPRLGPGAQAVHPVLGEDQEQRARVVVEQEAGLGRAAGLGPLLHEELVEVLGAVDLGERVDDAVEERLVLDPLLQLPVELLHLLLLLQLLVELPVPFHQGVKALDPAEGQLDVLKAEGLDQEVRRPVVHGVDGDLHGRVAGHDDHVDQLLPALERLEHVHPGHARQHDVQKDVVVMTIFELLEGGAPVVGGIRVLDPQMLEVELEGLADGGLVVHHQDAQGLHLVPGLGHFKVLSSRFLHSSNSSSDRNPFCLSDAMRSRSEVRASPPPEPLST